MRVLAGTIFIVGTAALLGSQGWVPSVPRTWDDEAVRTMELPLVGLGAPPRHVSSEYYYSTPTSRIPKTYPVYAPNREPAGYLDWLRAQEPEDAINFSSLRTQEEWVRAGQVVFDAPFNPSTGQAAERLREFSGSLLYPRPAKDGSTRGSGIGSSRRAMCVRSSPSAAVVIPGCWTTERSCRARKVICTKDTGRPR